MLAKTSRYWIENKTGATIQFATDSVNNTFTIRAQGWKYGSTGAIEYSSSDAEWFPDPTADLAADAAVASANVIDNGTDLFQGAHCVATLVTDAITSGSLNIYVEHSTDGGTTWPSDAANFVVSADAKLVTVLGSEGASTRSKPFEAR